MYILINAMRNLLRNKGRNILIAAVTLAIIISTVVTLTIGNASSKIIEDTRLRVGSKVNIAIDLQEHGSSGKMEMPEVGIDDFSSYAQSDYLSKSILSAQLYLYSATTFAVDDDSKAQGVWESNDGTGEIRKAGTMVLIGNSDPDTLTDFSVNGGKKILPGGKMYSGLDECIISSDLAELNGISVGDTISTRSVFEPVKDFGLVVVGIYSDETAAYPGPAYEEAKFFVFNRRNEIITSFETVMSKGFETDEGIQINAEYYLKNPDDISKFEAEVRAKGLPDDYSVSINQRELDGITGPLKSMAGITSTFMAVILILGAIVLVLLAFIAVRGRKYEVGVLRAMGMEKAQIAAGILSEAVLISLMCLIIGLGIGGVASQPIADSILSGQVEVAAVKTKADSENLQFLVMSGKTEFVNGLNGYTPVSEIQVALDAHTVIQITLIALALAGLSGVIGIAVITRYEPLKILRERN
ncbi:putative ABC transport system permease protein [Sporobacter termitidis DSM 10068]|uniref:Putative ABC transport system permease protein n=1 Tax=Sporobacter termitidis DSM 10068 TaxID=1123282 RepID=A0A1M5Z4R4_9FIRM|nr:FtsX-like permease family protein [Sporobacter termitidis]SHI18873.1 putative ABC transport system permease protein [Sporobacter termitidis DSM 10068]